MGEPFRDLGDPAAATRFAQHVGVAEDILDQIEQLPRRIDAWRNGDGVTQPLMDELARQWAKGYVLYRAVTG